MYTLPKLGIGERTILIPTPDGTIMWDLLSYIDDETVKALKAPPFNGLKAIVISHPHYYTNHLDWAEGFDCPVYISEEDEEWVSREDTKGRRRLISGETHEIVPGLTAIKVGGHFPGSLVLHWKNMLFLADSIVTQPVSRLSLPLQNLLGPRKSTSTPYVSTASSTLPFAKHPTNNFAVSALPHLPPRRYNLVHLHVQHSEHDPPPTIGVAQDVEGD